MSCAVALGAAALPAKPGPIVIEEADGTERTVFLHGDETFHYMTTEDGRWVEMREGRLTEVPALTEEQVVAERQRRAPRRMPATVTTEVPLNIAPRGLIILAQFSDLAFKEHNTLAAFNAMFNGEAYSYNGATGSARQYFSDQSFGQYVPDFDVVGPVTVSKNQSYYGANGPMGGDSHADELIIEACQVADTAFNVDFTQYDNDHDGMIDFVYVVYAGRGEADGGASYTIWPHTSWIYSGYGRVVRLDGLLLDTYACSNELMYASVRNGIGAFCHEFSHVLGLPDHYATNNATTKLTGDWDIMCSGNYNNNTNTPAGYTAYERFFLGWVKPTLLSEPFVCTNMQPLNTSGECYVITATGESNLVGNDPNPTEFYMLENRQKTGWDGYIPGKGLLITHIRYSYMKWTNNTVNNLGSSMGYDIIEADGKAPSYPNEGYSGKQGDAFPTSSVDSYTPFDGSPITGIKQNDDRTIAFSFKDVIPSIARSKAAELYGSDYKDIVAVYDLSGRVITTKYFNDLKPGTYMITLTNGKKTKGVKITIK